MFAPGLHDDPFANAPLDVDERERGRLIARLVTYEVVLEMSPQLLSVIHVDVAEMTVSDFGDADS